MYDITHRKKPQEKLLVITISPDLSVSIYVFSEKVIHLNESDKSKHFTSVIVSINLDSELLISHGFVNFCFNFTVY